MTQANETLRILIVDDEPVNIRLLVETLRDYGFDLLTALDGQAGLLSAREGLPDLILLDIRMPGLDGFAVCARLKADPVTRDIPVLFLTALTDTEQKLHAFQLGAIDYITKPFDAREVLARVLLHLQQDRLRRNLEQRLAALGRAGSPLIGEQAAETPQTPAQMVRGIERVVQQLRDHLDQTPTLDELARLACSNRRALNEEFQAAYSMSVFDWLREQRLSQAAHLLRTTDTQVLQIAGRVGFTSHGGFSKAFRERFGVSPAEYRQSERA
jgi:CheY-like chemotaxis protein/AraC-like DNA-binding protein